MTIALHIIGDVVLPLPALAIVGLSLAAPAVPAAPSPVSPGGQQEGTFKDALVEADGLFKQGKYDLALKAYKAANRKDGEKCADCVLGMAKTYVKLGAHKSAIDECDRLVLLAADDKQVQGVAFNLKGLALIALADVKRDQKTYVVIDHEGIFRARVIGGVNTADLQDAIKKGLKARAESAKAPGAPR